MELEVFATLLRRSCSPMIELVHPFLSLFFSICQCRVLSNPCYQMVLEDALDDLMQYVHRYKPVDVRAKHSPREWLSVMVHIQVKGSKMSVTLQMFAGAKNLTIP